MSYIFSPNKSAYDSSKLDEKSMFSNEKLAPVVRELTSQAEKKMEKERHLTYIGSAK